MIPAYLLAPLLQIAWNQDPDGTTEAVIAMIEYATQEKQLLTASVLKDYLGRLTRGESLV